jgi:hypothetical protein
MIYFKKCRDRVRYLVLCECFTEPDIASMVFIAKKERE